MATCVELVLSMDWKPLSGNELQKIIDGELAECSVELRAYFDSVAFQPT